MAVLLSEIPESLAGDALPHKTWTRGELEVLELTGLLDGRHFELIEGELIDKMGKKRRHVVGTRKMAAALRALFGDDCVDTEAPIDIAARDNPANEPEPDLVVVRPEFRSLESNPVPGDLALVVEIADTTLRQDLNVKARLYARAGIQEYWVLDLNGRCLHVLRGPSGGAYQVRLELGESESVSPLETPGRFIAVAAMLP